MTGRGRLTVVAALGAGAVLSTGVAAAATGVPDPLGGLGRLLGGGGTTSATPPALPTLAPTPAPPGPGSAARAHAGGASTAGRPPAVEAGAPPAGSSEPANDELHREANDPSIYPTITRIPGGLLIDGCHQGPCVEVTAHVETDEGPMTYVFRTDR